MKIELTTAAIIFEGNKILLIKRTKEPWKGLWHFPGGHVDEGEIPQDSVIREIKEETGLDAEIVDYRVDIEKLGLIRAGTALMRETGLDAEIVGEEKLEGDFRRLKNPIGMFLYPVLDHYHLSFLFHCRIRGKEIKPDRSLPYEGIVEWVNPKKIEISPYVRIVLNSILL